MKKISFDLIGNLDLERNQQQKHQDDNDDDDITNENQKQQPRTEEKFDWTGRASSLYCVVPGNISSDLVKIERVLRSLSENYHCVFYIPGQLEFDDVLTPLERIIELSAVCKMFNNVVLLYNHVCIVDGIALVAVTGKYSQENIDTISFLHNDLDYLAATVRRLQKHPDVSQIVCISGTVPTPDLYCGVVPATEHDAVNFTQILDLDTENKINYWLYGGSDNFSVQSINRVTYVTHPKIVDPYYPHRIEITF